MDIKGIYQELVLEHKRNPRNFGELAGADHSAQGHNPLCGDDVEVFIKLKDGRIEGISFKGDGCAISTASASVMTEVLQGKTVLEAEEMFSSFQHLVTQGSDQIEGASRLGKLKVFSGVRDYPARVKCATLAWHTMRAALLDKRSELEVDLTGLMEGSK